MNLGQPIHNPFLQNIKSPILAQSQLTELYTILEQGRGYLNIFGECGTGKTIVLQCLGKIDIEEFKGLGKFPKLVCIYINCRTKVPSSNPDQFWQTIFDELEKKDLGIGDFKNIERSCQSLASILEKLEKQSKHLLLALDEFDGIIPINTVDNSNLQNIRHFLTELRGLTSHDSSAILAIGTRCGLDKLWEPFANPGDSSEFPNNSTRFLLGLWQEKLFEAFLERSQVGDQSLFSTRQMRFIQNLSGRHPGLTKIAAKLLFNKRLDENTTNLTNSHLQEIAEQFIVESASTYSAIWRGMDEEEHLVVTIIVLENYQGKILNTIYSIKNINESLDKRIVNDLKGRHLLLNNDENLSTYQIFSPFFSEWIVQEIAHEPPDALQNRIMLYGGRISRKNLEALRAALQFLYQHKDKIKQYTEKAIKIAINIKNLI